MKEINTKRLKECREKIGITKMEAAKRLRLSQPAYLRYESGGRTPSFQTLESIAYVLNTSVEYLTDKTDDPHPNSYITRKEENPDLFDLVELCKSSDLEFTNRVLSYAKKLR